MTARIDRLPACRSTWLPIFLVSLAAIFEAYELYQTAYLPPGLLAAGIFSTSGLFGLSDQAAFGAVTFIGLFIGASCFSSVADRLGRRSVFVYALIGYCAASVAVACQSSALGIDFFRMLAGIGLGVELVTIDTFLVEITPAHMRGRAFALNHFVQYLGVPALAFLSWRLIPVSPLGVAGWRWVVLIGAVGAVPVWFFRRALPESPRWLALQGRHKEADLIVAMMEAQALADTGRPLAAPVDVSAEAAHEARFSEMWKKPYGKRTIMLTVFNFFQSIGFFGFANWLPTLVAAKGHGITQSLLYSSCIALAYPVMPLVWYFTVAERFERKWLIVAAALGVALVGPLFAIANSAAAIVSLGVGMTGFSVLLSLAYHPYQAELYPTQVRARAVGFVYSFSRLSAVFASFLVAFCLKEAGVAGVFALISFSMTVMLVAIACFGPRTRGRALDEIAR
ncbi:MFS transporter [Caballeronia sp. 15711]|uniref:MFS transporter n=1 Tax=Caballeronia sp. 15711 TaxID=3391029 RepID=UPI0039E350BF